LKKYLVIDIFEVFEFIKIEFCFDGMSTETKKHRFILTEKIDEDIIMLSENLVEVNQYLLVT
jgi:hypothetical protein